MKCKNAILLLACCGVVANSNGQGTIQIAFDNPPQLPGPGQSFSVQEYYEAGMWFRPLGVVGSGNVFSRRRGGGQIAWAPDNGTAYIAAALGSSLVFSFGDGSQFGLISVDLAEYSTVVSNAVTVPFVGYRQDGSTVTTSFTTDGVIDGSGPLADFETFTFGPEFSGLTRVEIPTFGWSLDNLAVAIPEPNNISLMLVGGGIVIWLRLCSRRSKSYHSNS